MRVFKVSGRPLTIATLLVAAIGLIEIPNARFMADDFIQLGVLEGVSPITWAGPFSLYTFSDGAPSQVDALKRAGAFPWFAEPGFKMRLFRPLS